MWTDKLHTAFTKIGPTVRILRHFNPVYVLGALFPLKATKKQTDKRKKGNGKK
jgi:hypothetical protein